MINTNLNSGQAPGFHLITGHVLNEMPNKCHRLLTTLGHFPSLSKFAQIILPPKPVKKLEQV